MKLKLDENVPASAAARLVGLGHEVHTVLDESLGGKRDAVVWAAAQAEGRMLVTCDLDFSDARKFAPGTHSGILLVRLPDEEQWRAADHLVAWLSDPDAPTGRVAWWLRRFARCESCEQHEGFENDRRAVDEFPLVARGSLHELHA